VLEVDGVAQGTRGPLATASALRARPGDARSRSSTRARALVIGSARAPHGRARRRGLDVATVDVNPVLVEVVAARWGIPGARRWTTAAGLAVARPGFDVVVFDAFQGKGCPGTS
jgi:hypothetical protein